MDPAIPIRDRQSLVGVLDGDGLLEQVLAGDVAGAVAGLLEIELLLEKDEIAIRQNFEDALRRQGYQVSGFGDRQSAMDSFRHRLPDLVIIDVGLGDDVEGGFELCRELRAMSRVLPIMFLTARDSDPDVISGLRLGAEQNLLAVVAVHGEGYPDKERSRHSPRSPWSLRVSSPTKSRMLLR